MPIKQNSRVTVEKNLRLGAITVLSIMGFFWGGIALWWFLA